MKLKTGHMVIAVALLLITCTLKPSQDKKSNVDSLTLYGSGISSSRIKIDSINLDQFGAVTAEIFMNSYLRYIDSLRDNRETDYWSSMKTWIVTNQLLTKNFKESYRNLVETALKRDPENGVGSDPVVDAQDSPNSFAVNGFTKDGFVLLQGTDWEEFRVTVKLVPYKNGWLVDGAGIINIPEDKQRDH